MTARSRSDAGDYRSVLDRSFTARYQRSGDSWTDEPAMRRVLEVVLPGLAADSRVLDVGAGRGRDTEALLTAGHRVSAVDLVTVPEWDEIASRWGERVRFHVGNVVEVNPGGEFDAVLDNGCLHHQHPDDYLTYLGVLRGALHPGGQLAVSFFVLEPEAAKGVLHTEEDGRLAREFTELEATALIASAGFTVTGQWRIPRRRPQRAYLVVTGIRTGD